MIISDRSSSYKKLRNYIKNTFFDGFELMSREIPEEDMEYYRSTGNAAAHYKPSDFPTMEDENYKVELSRSYYKNKDFIVSIEDHKDLNLYFKKEGEGIRISYSVMDNSEGSWSFEPINIEGRLIGEDRDRFGIKTDEERKEFEDKIIDILESLLPGSSTDTSPRKMTDMF